MFTGLIEQTSLISQIDPSSSTNPNHILTLSEAHSILNDCHIGDSICINGACLTVLEFSKGEGWFRVGLANETLARTNLGKVRVGDRVNCERAMSGHTRFGGHMVQGHVDTTATITAKTPDGDSIRYSFQLPPPSAHQMPYLIEKGYVTIDGASLTVTHVDDAQRGFGIMLISHSQSILTLTGKEIGDTVNIEVDCVGKYVLGSAERIQAMVERIVDKRLREKGLA